MSKSYGKKLRKSEKKVEFFFTKIEEKKIEVFLKKVEILFEKKLKKLKKHWKKLKEIEEKKKKKNVNGIQGPPLNGKSHEKLPFFFNTSLLA